MRMRRTPQPHADDRSDALKAEGHATAVHRIGLVDEFREQFG
jgi:hypothetical protein